jgi:hypothetical protein
VLVASGPQIDLVDVDGMEAPAAGNSGKAGAQVLVDQELELTGE